MAGLGACTTMTLRLYADRKGWPLDQVTVVVRHVVRAGPGQRDVFAREIRLAVELSAPERDRLLEIAERCPVGRALAAGVEIRSVLTSEPAVGEASS